MDDLVRQVLSHLPGMWRRRWVGLAIGWVVGLIAVVLVFTIPDQYEARARIQVDTQSILRPLLSGLAAQPELPDPAQQVAMLTGTLINRPNVERLVHAAGLDAGLTDPKQKEALVEDLLRGIKLTSEGEELQLFALSYRDPDPAKAERVVAGIVTVLMDSDVGSRREDADQARKFIDDQVRVYERRLEEAESRLKNFKLRNLSLTGEGQGRDYYARMSAAQDELSKARVDLHATERARDALKRELAGEEPIVLAQPGGTSRIAVPEIDGRLDNLRKQLDELLRRFTDSHPDVQATRRLVEQLEAERRQIIEVRRKAAAKSGATLAENPVIQQLRLSLSSAEASVASLQARVGALDARYTELRAAAQRGPQVEVELAQLNREYQVQVKNYEELVVRRESAAISGRMGATGFRTVDPARVSRTPVGPDRMLVLAGAFLAAIGAGLAASLLFSLIAPVVHDARSLREVAMRPVLGAISMVPDVERDRQTRRRAMAFLGGLGGLVSMYGTLFVILSVIYRNS